MLTASGWSAIADRAFGLQLALEAAGDLDQRFRVDGLPLWPLVREALFEQYGGILDQAVAEVLTRPAQAPPSHPRGRRWPSVSAVAEHGFRTFTGRVRRSRGGIAVLAQHGLAARGLPPPWDRWTLPFRDSIEGFSPATFISLRPPGAADLPLIAQGRYLPWQAGLELEDLAASRRLAGRLRRALAEVWKDPAVEAITDLPHRARLESVFMGLGRGLSLGWLLCRASDRLIEGLAPDVVLSFDALGNAGRAFARSGAQLGVPVVGVQAGVISPSGLTNLGYRLDMAPEGAPRPDRLLAWGDFHRDVLQRFGWEAGAIFVAGFESPLPPPPGRGLLYLASANLGVCASVAPPEGELVACRGLLEAARALGLPAVVRGHPGHAGTRHEADLARLARDLGAEYHGQDRVLGDDLAASRVVAGGASTAVVHAARAGRPLVLTALSGLELTGFASLGAEVLHPGDEPAGVLEGALAAGPQPARRIAEEVGPRFRPASVALALSKRPGPGPDRRPVEGA